MLVLDWSDLGSLCVYGPRCSVYRCGVDEDMTPILFVSRVIFSLTSKMIRFTPSCPFREFCFSGIAAIALEPSPLSNSLEPRLLGRLRLPIDDWRWKPATTSTSWYSSKSFGWLGDSCTLDLSVAGRRWNGSDILRVILK
jgi:hypothetical protein